MKSKIIIALIIIIFSLFDGFSQDYVHSTEGINKVEIISRVSVVLKTHNDPSFLISSAENKRIIKNDSGLKPVFGKDNTGYNVFVEENNRTLKVESFQPRTAPDLIIYLPETMKLYLENRINNDISIYDFKNEVEVKTNNGDIKIINVNGPVIIENTNGNTLIIFNEINQTSPISIINSHGDVDITLPSDTKADLEVSTPRGELFTDFELVIAERLEKEEGNKRPTRAIKSKLNDGGVSIIILASRGNVYLRKK